MEKVQAIIGNLEGMAIESYKGGIIEWEKNN